MRGAAGSMIARPCQSMPLENERDLRSEASFASIRIADLDARRTVDVREMPAVVATTYGGLGQDVG